MTTPDSARDRKPAECTRYANSHIMPPTAANPELISVAESFGFNLNRVRLMMIFPAMVAQLSSLLQTCWDVSRFNVLGTIDYDNLTEDQFGTIEPLARSQFELLMANLAQQRQTVAGIDATNRAIENTPLLANYSKTPAGGPAMDAILASYIIGTWTVLETMAGDLWEEAVNAHPAGLAYLGGNPSRLRKPSSNRKSPQPKSAEQLKSVPLSLINRHGFDIQKKMGSVLREKFRFNSLSGIREAFGCAFAKHSDDLDAILLDDALDALSAVRNVIVHKSARADLEYTKQASYLKIPQAKVGEPVLLDGAVVVGLISPAIQCGINLISAVDQWITADRSEPRNPEMAEDES